MASLLGREAFISRGGGIQIQTERRQKKRSQSLRGKKRRKIRDVELTEVGTFRVGGKKVRELEKVKRRGKRLVRERETTYSFVHSRSAGKLLNEMRGDEIHNNSSS
jgi:hypothetical protein